MVASPVHTSPQSTPTAGKARAVRLGLGATALIIGLLQVIVTLFFAPAQQVSVPYIVGAYIRLGIMVGIGLAMLFALRWRPRSVLDQRKGGIVVAVSAPFVVIVALIILFVDRDWHTNPSIFLGYLTMLVLLQQCVWLSYQGYVRLAVATLVIWWFGQVLINSSVSDIGVVFSIYIVCVLLAGLLSRWWTGIVLALFFPALQIAYIRFDWIATNYQATSIGVTFYSVMLFGTSLLIALYARSLEQAFAETEQRASELAAAQAVLANTNAVLEQRVAERTVALSEALAAQQAQADALSASLQEQQRLNQTISDLSFPVIPVRADTLVVPLVGVLADVRAAELTATVLRHVEQAGARWLYLDVTGVALVDTAVAQAIMQLATAVRMLGAETTLVGIRPEVAQTLVTLGADLGQIRTAATLQSGLESRGVIRGM